MLLERGLTVFLYDEAAKSAGWLDEIRHLIRDAPGFLAEMHPRALAAAPALLRHIRRTAMGSHGH